MSSNKFDFLQLFKYFVMAFSAIMTVYSLYDAFNGGVLGWVFGIAGIFVFEAAALYWQECEKRAKEGQLGVSIAAQWATMALSLLSTVVGISLLTDWGFTLRQSIPLGPIMILLIAIGLGVNMFAFLSYENEEPTKKRNHGNRLLEAMKANMEWEAKTNIIDSAQVSMQSYISANAPLLGERIAKMSISNIERFASNSLATSDNAQLPGPIPMRAYPSMAAAGGAPQGNPPGMNPRAPRPPVAVEVTEEFEDDDVTVQARPLAPKGAPRQTGISHPVSNRPTPVVREVPLYQTED